MKRPAAFLLAFGVALVGSAAERRSLPNVSSARAEAFTDGEQKALATWALLQPEVRKTIAGHRTRVLRVWSDVVKGHADSDSYRRAVVLLRDYDAGLAREISINLATGAIRMRELIGIQPSREEVDEGMAIVRSEPALARFISDPNLLLMGGFHNRSTYPDDPCAREICLDFAFMRPDYGGPERYVIVNLTRRVVANVDFRARPGERPARMTRKPTQ